MTAVERLKCLLWVVCGPSLPYFLWPQSAFFLTFKSVLKILYEESRSLTFTIGETLLLGVTLVLGFASECNSDPTALCEVHSKILLMDEYCSSLTLR